MKVKVLNGRNEFPGLQGMIQMHLRVLSGETTMAILLPRQAQLPLSLLAPNQRIGRIMTIVPRLSKTRTLW